ncbi:Oidioi.mRNA.OKI2018_I69.chr1.g2025.t1.cds [Oikopleura dioica]|uniref:Oidioi.mRNA.OKI2018_I69.chr1.g2025.t1.cds n=1 Tax=Oikopleura dioica TaxID=34765 RepID=A0ABN7STM9_OIKDI|nr:Oidioi.mRNA.OKI2018_I69.chr1.g2025.t1.cds [Oikopleura dioica]
MTTGSDAPQQTTKPKKSRSKRQREANSEFLVDFGKLTLPTMKRYKRSVDPNYEDQVTSKNRAEFIHGINQHFRNSPVPDENETIHFFLYVARHHRLKHETKEKMKTEH